MSQITVFTARAYSAGSIVATCTLKAHNNDEAIRLATEKLGHCKHGVRTDVKGGNIPKVAVIGVRANS